MNVTCTTSMHGDTLPGSIFVSKAGRLPFKHIVHAVAPKWFGGKREEETLLFVAIEKALTEAVQSRLQTVALPASFAESYGYPVDVAVRSYCECHN
jgi:O-acetyl-ADP-ribose deacetylase (regulator of RNase III)